MPLSEFLDIPGHPIFASHTLGSMWELQTTKPCMWIPLDIDRNSSDQQFLITAIKYVQSVQFSLVSQSRPTLCDPMNCSTQASLSITNSQSSPKLMSIESVMPFYHLLFCHPLLLLPSIFPSIRVFSSESALPIRWPKDWTFSPSNEYLGLISFRMDWLDLLVVQGTHESSPTPQFKSISSSALSFLYVQLSRPYMTTGKSHSLD